MAYTVVVALQRVENNTTQATQELDRFGVAVADNETWLRQVSITPTMRGQRLRLAFLLYRGSPPAHPTVANAYRELHLWVNVTAAD